MLSHPVLISTLVVLLNTFQIMPCAQNAKAIVNAGFKIKLCNKDALTVGEATIVFGGITPNFVSFYSFLSKAYQFTAVCSLRLIIVEQSSSKIVNLFEDSYTPK